MRILHLSSLYAPDSFGGAEKVVETLAEISACSGMEVAVACVVRNPTQASCRNGVQLRPLTHRNLLWIEDSARYPGIVRNFNKIVTLLNVSTAADFREILCDFKPDIVHSHSMVELTPMMWKLAKHSGATVIHTLHDYDLLCIRATLFKGGSQCHARHLPCAVFSKIKRAYHRYIDAVVGVSQSILQTHLEFGFFEHLVPELRRVIWNPVRDGVSAAAGVRKHEAPASQVVLGFIGRLVDEKGISILLQACALLKSRAWKLRVAGRAPRADSRYRELARGMPVEFVGYMDRAEFFSQIDLLVIPSIWKEPFGLVVLEAYKEGVPVLGSDVGGIAEIIRAVDEGALFPPDNPPALASRLDEFIEKRAAAPSREKFAAVCSEVNPEVVMQRYLSIYHAALLQSTKEIQ